ncbi:MAG: hypothetical protein AAB074_13440 [Planctomycetota bacterium]
MHRRPVHGRHRFTALKAASRNALLLLCAAGCAARGTVVAHSENRPCGAPLERLVAEAQIQEDGTCLLSVVREQDQVFERDYWTDSSSAPLDPMNANSLRIAEGTPFGQPAPSQYGDMGPAGIVLIALYGSFWLVYLTVEWISDLFSSDFRQLRPLKLNDSPDRVTVRHTETIRRASTEVILSRADGSAPVFLGVQPAGGYVLGAPLVEQLGGRGARILVRDGDLTATATLGLPR